MKKSWLYRLFGVGTIPRKLRPTLEAEGILVADEGMGGRVIFRNVRGPGKRYVYRIQGFSGWLVVTRTRVVCHALGKRQIHIPLDDPKMAALSVDVPAEHRLSIAFESADFRKGWNGRIEYRFNTDKAFQFCDALWAAGAQRKGDAEIDDGVDGVLK